jgi:hypothetical protein
MYPSALVKSFKSFLRRGRIPGDDDDDNVDDSGGAAAEAEEGDRDRRSAHDASGASADARPSGPRGIDRVLVPRRAVGAWACQPRDGARGGAMSPSMALLTHFGSSLLSSGVKPRPSRRSGHVAVMVSSQRRPHVAWPCIVSLCHGAACRLVLFLCVFLHKRGPC